MIRALVRGVASLAALVWSCVLLLLGVAVLASFIAAFLGGFNGVPPDEVSMRSASVSAQVPVRGREGARR